MPATCATLPVICKLNNKTCLKILEYSSTCETKGRHMNFHCHHSIDSYHAPKFIYADAMLLKRMPLKMQIGVASSGSNMYDNMIENKVSYFDSSCSFSKLGKCRIYVIN
jgi:hypothetical protein